MFANPNYKIDASPTKFSIITEKNIQPNNIRAQNHFSQEKFFVKYFTNFDAAETNKFNNIIFDELLLNNNKKIQSISGQIKVKKNLVLLNL